MFARIVKSNLKADHVAEFNQKMEQQVIPMLRKAKGFRNAIALVGAGGTEAVSLTLWDLKENAEAYNSTTFPEVLKALSTVLEGNPHVKTYEVTSSTFEKIAAHAAV
jgi:heme-degrading monooxygenase HmoA